MCHDRDWNPHSADLTSELESGESGESGALNRSVHETQLVSLRVLLYYWHGDEIVHPSWGKHGV